MISHLKEKPSKESILETLNKAAKIEFDFLLNGIKSTELIDVDSNEIIHLIDVNTKALKIKVRLFFFVFYLFIFVRKLFFNKI
jgi:hypothetical protein